jgi:parvulin-like peptidyl-prolyl isomerase
MRRGITASDREIDTALAAARRQYRTREAFDEAQRRAGVSAAQLRREIDRLVVIQKAYAESVTAACQVTRADAEAFYTSNPGRFVIPEQIQVFAITIGVDPSSTAAGWAEAKKRALDVRRRLEAGAPFEAMAREYSSDPSRDRGGDMGFVHRGSLADEFEDALKDLRPGEISEVVQTLYGYHIVRIGEIRPAAQQPFAGIAERIESDLSSMRCAEQADAWSARLRAAASIEIFPR